MKQQESSRSQPAQVLDMSGEAVLGRLRLVGQLNELCHFLGNSDLASKARQGGATHDQTATETNVDAH